MERRKMSLQAIKSGFITLFPFLQTQYYECNNLLEMCDILYLRGISSEQIVAAICYCIDPTVMLEDVRNYTEIPNAGSFNHRQLLEYIKHGHEIHLRKTLPSMPTDKE